jgi:foldase protein PrsA
MLLFLSKPLQQSRLWMYVSLILALILVVYIIFFPPGKQSGNETVTLAKVNGVSIGKDKLYDALVATSGQQTLGTLINNELIRQAAEKAGVKVTDADIDKELESIQKSYPSEEEFQQELTAYGMTLEGLKKELVTQVQIRKLMEPLVNVTNEDIKKYYDENLQTLKTPEQVKASHILVATKEEADAILTELKSGADFAAKAKEKSKDTATKDTGGELELITRGETEEVIEKAVFALEVGGLSGVVKASDGFHIYKLTEYIASITPTLEEKKEEIRGTLTDDQITTLSESWMTDQQSSASIENFLGTAS